MRQQQTCAEKKGQAKLMRRPGQTHAQARPWSTAAAAPSPTASAEALLQSFAVRAQLRRLDARDTRAQTEAWFRNSVRRLSPGGLLTFCSLLVAEGRKRVIRTIDSAVLLAMIIVCQETRGESGLPSGWWHEKGLCVKGVYSLLTAASSPLLVQASPQEYAARRLWTGYMRSSEIHQTQSWANRSGKSSRPTPYVPSALRLHRESLLSHGRWVG